MIKALNGTSLVPRAKICPRKPWVGVQVLKPSHVPSTGINADVPFYWKQQGIIEPSSGIPRQSPHARPLPEQPPSAWHKTTIGTASPSRSSQRTSSASCRSGKQPSACGSPVAPSPDIRLPTLGSSSDQKCASGSSRRQLFPYLSTSHTRTRSTPTTTTSTTKTSWCFSGKAGPRSSDGSITEQSPPCALVGDGAWKRTPFAVFSTRTATNGLASYLLVAARRVTVRQRSLCRT